MFGMFLTKTVSKILFNMLFINYDSELLLEMKETFIEKERYYVPSRFIFFVLLVGQLGEGG